MKISILLPLKENFSPSYPGAVSLFVNDTLSISKYKKNCIVYGNTDLKKKFKLNYKNISVNKNFFKSQNKSYVEEFIKLEKKRNSDLIELHNRPIYLKYLIRRLSKKNYYKADHDKLRELGFQATRSIDDEIELMLDNMIKFKDRVLEKKDSIIREFKWQQ